MEDNTVVMDFMTGAVLVDPYPPEQALAVSLATLVLISSHMSLSTWVPLLMFSLLRHICVGVKCLNLGTTAKVWGTRGLWDLDFGAWRHG